MTRYTDLFGDDGPLAAALPGYGYRPEQAAMAGAVADALARGEPLIVEAGTGTGKTFAYLVPALLSGRSVIISTGTRTLQDQLYRRDLPLLAKALGLPVKVALLKGRSNYLCRHRLDLATRQATLPGTGRGAARMLARVALWATRTRSGDLAELTDLPDQSPLLKTIQAVDSYLNIKSRVDCASTDANVPLSMGLPAVSIGAGGQGGGAHTSQEWYSPEGRDLGLRRVLLILAALADRTAEPNV